MVVLFRQKLNGSQQNSLKSKDVDSLLKSWKILRKIWVVLGVIPVMGSVKVYIRLQQMWCVFLLLLTWCMCLNEIRYVIKFGTTITKGFYSMEMFFYIFLVSSVFYTSFVNKRKFIKIYEKFPSLQEQLKMCHSIEVTPRMSIYRQLKREMLFVSFWHLIFYSFCISINIVRFLREPMYLFRILCVYYGPNILISANFCLLWLALRFISLSYSYTNKILKSLQQTMKSPLPLADNVCQAASSLWFEKEFCTFNLRKPVQFPDIFITLTEIRTSLDQLMRDVINMFSVILILNFGNAFMLLSVNYFAVYKFFDSKDVGTLLMFLLKFARILMHMFNIVFTLFANHSIINEKCDTIYILNSLPVESVEMEKSINGYLLQLMVRRHSVWVCDIFELDLTFLLSVISALSTYVIFLIQIDLGAVTIEGKSNSS